MKRFTRWCRKKVISITLVMACFLGYVFQDFESMVKVALLIQFAVNIGDLLKDYPEA